MGICCSFVVRCVIEQIIFFIRILASGIIFIVLTCQITHFMVFRRAALPIRDESSCPQVPTSGGDADVESNFRGSSCKYKAVEVAMEFPSFLKALRDSEEVEGGSWCIVYTFQDET